MAEVSGGRVLGRLRLSWMDGVKVALGKGEMLWRLRERTERVESPGAYVTECVSLPFLLGRVLSDRPPMLWWLSPGEG